MLTFLSFQKTVVFLPIRSRLLKGRIQLNRACGFLTQFIINKKYPGSVYSTVVLKYCSACGGYVFSPDDTPFELNPACANVMIEIIKKVMAEKYGMKIQTSLSLNSISITVRDNSSCSALRMLLGVLFSTAIHLELFEQVKNEAVRMFVEKQQQPEFIAKLKLFEFTNQCKRFSLSKYMENAGTVSLADYKLFLKSVVKKENCVIIFSGDVETIDENKLYDCLAPIPSAGLPPRCFSYLPDTELFRDAFCILDGDTEQAFYAMRFDMSPRIALVEKRCFMEFVSAILFNMQAEIYSDHFDCSIVYPGNTDKSNIDVATVLTDENVEKAQKLLLVCYSNVLNSSIADTINLLPELAVNGIDIYEMLKLISNCSGQALRDFAARSGLKVTHGKVVYMKKQ